MNIQKMCFRKEWGKKKRGELTLINIRCGENESLARTNFNRQLIMSLSNYTGEFTNDFFQGARVRKKIIPLPITLTGSPPIPAERAIRANSSRAVIVYREKMKAES